MQIKKYELLTERFGVPKGSIVYDSVMCDYGCANDDTRAFGYPHKSVTLKSDGSYPFITAPVSALREIKDDA